MVENRLAEVRKAAGLTQRQLADLVGVTDQTISNIERGANVPDVETALALARALFTPVERLFVASLSTKDVEPGSATATAPSATAVAERPAADDRTPERTADGDGV